MREIVTGSYAVRGWNLWTPRTIRVVDWNIERGLKLPAILDFLLAQDADLLVLQEVDVNARRTHCLNIADEIARSLRMDYVFGCEFEELTEGSRTSPAYIGQATISRWPLVNSRLILFQRQSTFWNPRWWVPGMRPFQERLGGRVALLTEMRVAGRSLAVYNLHLESRGQDELRLSQLHQVFDDAQKFLPQMPVLVAGDVNFDTSQSAPAGVIQEARFWDAVDVTAVSTTSRRGLFSAGRSIDRALIAGPIRGGGGRVNSSVQASDHYPLTFLLEFA